MTAVDPSTTAGDRTGGVLDDSDLRRAWASPPGIPGFLSAVNHKQIGLRFIWTGMAFFLVGGIEGLIVRLQLAQPDNTLLDPAAYNQLFTMHGTTMMFLFAVPMLEGLAMYFTPLLLGTRDLPFPRLNAFGYWCYLFGGILLNWSFLTGSVPDGGWFAYTPLTGAEFSPSRAMDFWLIGVTLVEIAGIVGALELVVLVLKQRAPGMSLGRMPIFAWAVLTMSAMMLVAFPFVVVASVLLELERKLGMPFYDVSGGGNPLLWQHLFWIFGHPDVYIMLLPAVGVVSAVVVAHCRRRIVAYPFVVAALVAIAIASFGLWVHHMFAVGLPILALSFFAVASYFIAVPSGVQIFAWLATMWEGRPRWDTPMWFVAGFIVVFTLGGITGVMVATVPFDFQAHDTFFVVAHFHYVLIGGVVFPIFAGLHHWFPKLTGRMPREGPGKAAFWLMFVGFNVTFFPQHWLGLQGMVRRVYSYRADLGWGAANLVSTVGAFVLAAGVLVFVANLLWAWRSGRRCGDDPWGADSLEWATTSPPPVYNFRTPPLVAGRAPQWDDAHHGFDSDTAYAVASLARPHRGRREVLRTSVLDARPEAVVVLHGNSYWPVVTALAITVGLVGVLVDWYALAAVGTIGTVGCLLGWLSSNRRDDGEGSVSDTDEPATEPSSGRPAEVLTQARALAERRFRALGPPGLPAEHWGVVTGLVAIGIVLGALVYSYFYLRISTDVWPPDGVGQPPLLRSVMALGFLAGAAIAYLPRWWRSAGWRPASITALVLSSTFVLLQTWDLLSSGHRVDSDAYSAIYVTVQAAGLLVGAVGLIVAGVILWLRHRSGWDEGTRIAATYWWLFGSMWLVLWATTYLAPRLT